MIARTVYRSILVALLLGLAAAALLGALRRPSERLIVQARDVGPFLADGETAQLRNFFGFYDPESAGATRFRWTTGEGSFVVRSGSRLGEPLLLDLRLCGCRPTAGPAPRLRLRINGETLVETRTTAGWDQWRRYRVLAPQHAAAYSPDLLVELLSDHVPNSETGAPLGVAFDWARLGPLDEPPRAYSTLAALGLGALAGGLVLLARARGLSLRGATLAGLLGIGLATAQGILYRPQSLPAGVLALGLLLGVGLALALADSPATIAGLALLLGALVLAAQTLGAWMLDDAFISFRYARNALTGYGFVFNPGERVEGYTNFLWTALFVPVLGAGAAPTLVSQAITLLLALAVAALTWAGARRLAGRWPTLAAAALLVSSTPFVLYTARGSGMETALFTLLMLGGILAYLQLGIRDWGLGARDREKRRHGDTETRRARIFDPRSSILDPRSSILAPRPVTFSHPSLIMLPVAGALLALAAMTRPEGVLVAGVTGLHLLYVCWHEARPTAEGQRGAPGASARYSESTKFTKPAKIGMAYLGAIFVPFVSFVDRESRTARIAWRAWWRQPLAFAAGFLAIFGPYYLWRLAYYGYPLPNTFYAKVGGTLAQALRGIGYAAGFGAAQAPLIAIILLGAWYAARGAFKPDRRSPAAGYLWSIAGAYILYIIAVGGDHFPFYRFFVPLMPPLALAAALALDRLGATLPRRTAAPAMALLAAAGVAWQIPQLYDSRTLNTAGQVWGENSVVEKNREIGLWLREHTPSATLIATGIAGALPYYAERPTLDSLGLNDLHIAHLDVPAIGQGIAGSEKTDVDYILSRRPDYIPHNSSGPFQANPVFATTYELIITRGPEGRGLRLYRRIDSAAPDTAREAAP